MVAKTLMGRSTFRWLVIGVCVLLAASLGAPLGPVQAAPAAFAFGQQVEARSPGVAINLRGEPGLSGRVVTTLPNGTTVTIIGGPRLVDGVNWWEVDGGERARYGWAAESLLKPARPSPAQHAAARRAQCAVTGPVYPGVYHCQRAHDVHVVVIDLNDPHVRFETVMAYDAADVRGGSEEWVGSMAERHAATVAAINGDYFSPGANGPEGLTISSGAQLDTLNTMERSALVIGQAPLDSHTARLPIPAAIVRLAELEGSLEAAQHYNAVGGGPQVVFNSAWTWTEGFGFPGYRGCAANLPPEQVINGECLANISDWMEPATPWSAAGLTADRKMVWAVGPYDQLPGTLAAFGVTTAMKLDGGGSSQLWYDRTLVHGYRPVANGLLVFYQQAVEVVEPARWQVLMAGETPTLRVTLRNAGADTWTADAVTLVGPGPTRVSLPHDVPPGETVRLAWTTTTTATCGWRRDTWRLAENGVAFPGEGIVTTRLVLPQGMEAEHAQLNAQWRAGAPALPSLIERKLRLACGSWFAVPAGSTGGSYR